MEGRVFENFQKNQKTFKIPKMLKIVPKSVQKCFEHVSGQFFREVFIAQCSMDGRVFENFQKNQKLFKNPKMPKIVPKSVQTCFEHVFGCFFRKKKLLPSVPWRVESSKSFKKIKKLSIFQKCSKSFPKVSKRVLNMFRGSFFEKFLLPSVPWTVESSKIFKKIKKISKIQKCPKSFSKVSKRVLNMFSCVFFPKKTFAQCSMGGRVFENFQKSQKIFKIPKMPKIVPKSVQTGFEHVFGVFFSRTKLLPSVAWRVDSSKFFKKIKKFSKIQKCPKSFPKVSKRVLNMFSGVFFENKTFAQCSMEGRVFENFQKIQKLFKNPKEPKIVPKSVQTCFEHVLG